MPAGDDILVVQTQPDVRFVLRAYTKSSEDNPLIAVEKKYKDAIGVESWATIKNGNDYGRDARRETWIEFEALRDICLAVLSELARTPEGRVDHYEFKGTSVKFRRVKTS